MLRDLGERRPVRLDWRGNVTLSVPRLAAEFSRAEGITIKLVIRGTSTGFADVR